VTPDEESEEEPEAQMEEDGDDSPHAAELEQPKEVEDAFMTNSCG